MRRQLALVVGVCALCICLSGSGLAGRLGVVRSIPYPRGAVFINDMAFDGSHIWTTGINTIVPMGGDAKSSVITYRVNLHNGGVSRWWPARKRSVPGPPEDGPA